MDLQGFGRIENGFGGIGFGRVWRDLDGFEMTRKGLERMWRDLESMGGFGRIWRDLDGSEMTWEGLERISKDLERFGEDSRGFGRISEMCDLYG